ncbi:MAG TPA: flagellar basal-body rod protein FlgG [Planctomycetes bacterium]|nr:flagellar basal-body rod protein FlgG [Planctomycetota bacterium]
MIKALFTAATGMRAQQTRIDVIANNLANVNTTGFKKSQANFEDLLYSNMGDAGTQKPAALQIGAGSRLVSTTKVFAPGVLEETGRALDLVITGNGFFQLQDINGGTVYTRDGNFHADSNGDVVNSQGLKLVPSINVPAGATLAIAADGTISARVGDQAATQLGQLQLVNFRNPAGLDSTGGNLLRETAASGTPTTGTPGQNGYGTIVQGFLERSNVDVVNELVSLIVSQRAYETNSRAISSADQMLTTVNQILQ